MKTIKTTHIDNGGGNGFYSVSKKDIKMLGIQDKISAYSGLTLNTVYLEGDTDATLMYDRARELGIKIDSKSSYNRNFTHTHNYNAGLFDWTPKKGDKIMVGKVQFTITCVDGAKCLFIINRAGQKCRIEGHRIFFYVTKLLTA